MSNIVRPSILSGFMELLPQDQIIFDQMKSTIQENFEEKGFYPLDTPVLERTDVLLAKGGGETEKQIYAFKKGNTEMAMRFDLTVPLARYVAEHLSDLNFPFRRYHIGKVYRGERAQKGRFREFYQCDIDIIGNGKLSLFNDAEIPSIIESTFEKLGFENFTIHMNNRKILNGFYASLAIEDPQSVLRQVDKLDKIGKDKVSEALVELGISEESVGEILKFIEIEGTNEEIIAALRGLEIENELFNEGVDELEQVIAYTELLEVDPKHVAIDLSIARGLDYYTGTVYETILDDYPQIGSVCSGGRYDNLAEHYTTQSLPGVGISIGLSRLYYQLNEAGLLKSYPHNITDLIIIPMRDCFDESVKIMAELRNQGVKTFMYSESGKLGKKFKYADQMDIPYVLVIGENELESGEFTLRDMKSGEEHNLNLDEIVKFLKK